MIPTTIDYLASGEARDHLSSQVGSLTVGKLVFGSRSARCGRSQTIWYRTNWSQHRAYGILYSENPKVSLCGRPMPRETLIRLLCPLPSWLNVHFDWTTNTTIEDGFAMKNTAILELKKRRKKTCSGWDSSTRILSQQVKCKFLWKMGVADWPVISPDAPRVCNCLHNLYAVLQRQNFTSRDMVQKVMLANSAKWPQESCTQSWVAYNPVSIMHRVQIMCTGSSRDVKFSRYRPHSWSCTLLGFMNSWCKWVMCAWKKTFGCFVTISTANTPEMLLVPQIVSIFALCNCLSSTLHMSLDQQKPSHVQNFRKIFCAPNWSTTTDNQSQEILDQSQHRKWPKNAVHHISVQMLEVAFLCRMQVWALVCVWSC